MTDQQLLQGIINRNPEAIKSMVDNYQSHIIRVCYSLVHNLEDSEDLAQEVFLEVIRSAARFRGEAKVSSWMYRIAVNKSLNHIRRKNRATILSLGFFRSDSDDQPVFYPERLSTYNEGDTGMQERELKVALHYAINKLPENQRIAFVLHHYEDLACKEICEIMTLSLSAVESLIHRAKRNLRSSLTFYYHDHEKRIG